MVIQVSANKIASILTGIISFLLVAHCIQAYLFLEGLIDYVRFLDFDIERNLPTFYSVVAIEIAAFLLFVIYLCQKQKDGEYLWAWLVLSILFAFLGLDEATKIHENAGDIISATFEATGIFYFPWVVPYSVALIFLSVICLPWLFSLPLHIRIRFILSAIVFLSGALGLEMLSAVYAEQTSLDSYEYIRTYTIEETLEMLGIVIFVHALIRYLLDTVNEITVKFTP